MYLDSSSIPLNKSWKPTALSTQAQSIELCKSTKNQQREKPITYLFEARIEICLNQYLKNIISHLLEGFLEREKHPVYVARDL